MIKNYLTSKCCLIIGLSIFSLQSCKKRSLSDNIQNETGEYFIDQNEASAISKDFSNKMHDVSISLKSNGKKLYSANNNVTSSSINSAKTVDDVTPVKDSNGQNAYYIINYKEGGFTIISADKRTISILSYFETGRLKQILFPRA